MVACRNVAVAMPNDVVVELCVSFSAALYVVVEFEMMKIFAIFGNANAEDGGRCTKHF
tara:strand:- start:133 stop:306 length:174 start_codon:yes stop_codon:yes gene_type:complete